MFLRSEVWRMWQPRQRRNTIHRCVEYELRPLRRSRILERLGLQSPGHNQVGRFFDHGERSVAGLEGSHPGRGIQLVLDMGITVACAAHKCGRADYISSRMLRDDLLAAQP